MNRNLVIGGAGFVGSHLIEKIVSNSEDELLVLDSLLMGNMMSEEILNHPRVQFSVCNATDIESLKHHIDSFCPNVIYHLAANSDIKKGSSDSSYDLNNTFLTTSSLAVAITSLNRPIPNVVFSSTSAIYGQLEGAINASSPQNPVSPYGWMKLASEALLRQLHTAKLIERLLVVRFPNVTGGRQTHGVVRDLVRKYFESSDWVILGDGSQDKPYTHIVDLVDTIWQLTKNPKLPDLAEVNIGPSDGITVSEIVNLIEVHAGLGKTPIYGASPSGWPGDVPRYSYDTNELDILGIRLPSSRNAISRSIEDEVKRYLESEES